MAIDYWAGAETRGGVSLEDECDNEIEAARARDAKAKQLQGPFAYLNFPKEEQV